MKNLTLLFFLFFQTLSLAFANGGVVDENYFKKTGNIRLLQKADISLLKEDLRIKIVSDTTFIEVTYLLKNNGNTQSVHYGFPVDRYKSDWRDEPYTSVLYFEAFVNQKTKKHEHWKTEQTEKENDKNYEIIREWYGLTLDFKKGRTQTLTIKYAIQNYRSDYYYAFYFIPDPSERRFVYDLFPSSSWGNGIVSDLSVTMDLSDLKKHECSTEITGLEGLENKNQDGIYTLQTQNFDLKKESFISITYDNSKRAIDYCLKNVYKFFPISSISSSAENAEYLIDNDPNTVWKGKEGDWIKIKVQSRNRGKNKHGRAYFAYPVGLAFLNGDYSSKENFETLGKAKEITVQLDTIPLVRYFREQGSSEGAYLENFIFTSSLWFLEGNNPYEVITTPLTSEIWQYMENDMGMYLMGIHKTEEIVIKIKKSTHSNKEVSISEIYLFEEMKNKSFFFRE
ncbi:hypothetical protein Fleli_1484 [Bernardetia litoralis DSM 6794]|uniref:DUF4424 domain-containing protein n=1 Tax=Bernardetia litoralis (strain ATCC 23117 / DSM 6794 / NBRC 15988 / NCIMB 1366 / Fx l1 / Sio-4) TaxID=880071 RepID=I4AIX3_BERLS|nr:hypothetical protein [Bernardetia litoralis]AFM03908.1 hypothetical protein Fleli_1484 [Bernardetia litoralis DSM 6794]